MISFDTKFEQNCSKSTGLDFEYSLNHVLQSNATMDFPKFAKGTLPKQFESSPVVAETKRKMGGDMPWLDQFVKNRELHFQMHGGKVVEHVPEEETKSNSSAKSPKAKSGGMKGSKAESDEDDELLVPIKKPLRTKGTLWYAVFGLVDENELMRMDIWVAPCDSDEEGEDLEVRE